MASTKRKTGCLEAEDTARLNDVMELLIHIATVKKIYAAFKHSKRGAAVTGASMVVGAALLGPVGLAVGGAVGGLLGWMTSEDFKPVPQVLMELSPAEKQKLCAEAMAVVKNFDWTDAAELIKFVMANSFIRDKVLGVLTTFLTNEFKAQVKYGK
ncbi:protein C19orf12 homolog [Passer montanus]|uniref:protein C19orf12 homolog n=1 Tax=Passer montanus TaxID=9160 RepID=UPI00195F366E|nr:protein C19orf12 homolog [Passer montanus]XP_039581558.1 protein C19orf12 homolog [Passer montanus]XP_039581559.1 protein C19orf12 homolog [Passer montanus]XP_039581560.1 protein C19orf12 homolog [Passer montanus]XP_039581561.1 protein C19orf12 homolog [Passer montanus]